jgi:acyl-CoA synthetase (AMP-forming)/AMP-acid ligase II
VAVRTGDDGELQVRTPALSAGYADGVDLADRMTDDGWFRTGDFGRVDEDGFVWIDGRVSDMINRGGLKVFPEEVAEVLRLSPSVLDVAVTAGPDERLGEVPVAYVVAAGGRLDVDELTSLCRAHLAPYKVPVAFELVDVIPRNEAGKIVAAQLRR